MSKNRVKILDEVLVDKTLLTRDEQYNAEGQIGDAVQHMLEAIKMDTYNEQYMVRIVVTKIKEK